MNWAKTIWKTVKAFLIAVAVVALGGVIEALGGFTPEPGMTATIWALCGAGLIGALTGLLNWLKHRND